MRFAVANGLLHDQGIASVETAGDIGDIDQWEELEIWSAGTVAVLLRCQYGLFSLPLDTGIPPVINRKKKLIRTASPKSQLINAFCWIGDMVMIVYIAIEVDVQKQYSKR